MSNNIKKKEWKIGDTKITYYFDKKFSDILEKILPHEEFSMKYPFDTAIRGALLPFAVLSANKEYGGLDQEGYNQLGDLIKNNERKPMGWLFIGSTSLDDLAKPTDNLPFLKVAEFEGRKVYFPSAPYVVGNK